MMGDFIFLVLGGLIGFALGLVLSIPNIKKIVRVQRAPSYSIDMIPDGRIVEGTGKVLSEGRILHSPLAQTACVLWHAEVEEGKSSGEDTTWETAFNETSIHPFEIRDAKGILRVYPKNAELILHVDFYKESGPLVGTLDPDLKSALWKLQIPPTGPMGFTKSFRVHEQVIKADETVYILGRITEKDGVRVISSQGDDSPFIISDRSQRALLGTLYWRVISIVFILTCLGIFIFRWISSQP